MPGLGSCNIQQNDLICALFECSVPVVIRRPWRLITNGQPKYSIIGECFVDGKMDGETIAEETCAAFRCSDRRVHHLLRLSFVFVAFNCGELGYLGLQQTS
jgi:hypothetical protein